MAKTPPRTKAQSEPWLRFPMKPDHPVIVMLNWQIQTHIEELNSERHYMAECQTALLGQDGDGTQRVYRTKDMMPEDALVSYERVDGRGSHPYFIDPHRLQSIQYAAFKIKFLDDQISWLTRMKLRLFGDVDFEGGRERIRDLNKLMEETIQRMADRKEHTKAFRRARRSRIPLRFASP